VGPTCRREKKRKRKRRKSRERVRAEAGWAAARSWAQGAAQLGCALLLSFFFCSNSFFLFLFCDLSYNFYILAPNRFKQLGNFFLKFKVSKWDSKKQVFKIK
jgi:hypothetical protein